MVSLNFRLLPWRCEPTRIQQSELPSAPAQGANWRLIRQSGRIVYLGPPGLRPELALLGKMPAICRPGSGPPRWFGIADLLVSTRATIGTGPKAGLSRKSTMHRENARAGTTAR